MHRLACVLLVVVGCNKEAPKGEPNKPAPGDPARPSTGTPTRSAKVELPKPKPASPTTAQSNLPPEANPPGAPVLSGEIKVDRDVRYIDEVVGTGVAPVSRKKVSVHYTGWLTDGKQFDSSHDRGDPITFTFDGGQVIKGWDIGLSSMKVGGKRRIIIPAELAYGDQAKGNVIPAGSMLVFDVELTDAEQ
jgi:peptidylprolyl isomerase